MKVFIYKLYYLIIFIGYSPEFFTNWANIKLKKNDERGGITRENELRRGEVKIVKLYFKKE